MSAALKNSLLTYNVLIDDILPSQFYGPTEKAFSLTFVGQTFDDSNI